MYACCCNPFSDKDVKVYLEDKSGQRVTLSELYHTCSGGESPNCTSCLEDLKASVKDHNGKTPSSPEPKMS